MFKHEPCSCPPDLCLKEVDPPRDCVNRLTGTVEPVECEKCGGQTLHHNGECLRCQRKSSQKEQALTTSLPSPQDTHASTTTTPHAQNNLTLTITLGGNGVVVTDKKQVAKIIKILLEE
jgi:hypothetical protein